jgi:hypothetical protein
MDRKEATTIAMITTTLLATILTMTSSTSAFALGHWNLDEDFVPSTGMANSDTESTDVEEEGSDEESETANTDDGEEGSDEESETANTDDGEEGSDEESETANTDDEEEGSDEESETANTDDEERENSADTGNPDGNEDPSQLAYEDLQACLSDGSTEGSPSEQEVQDCIDSSYGGNDGPEQDPTAENDPSDGTDEVDESGDGVTEEVSSDDSFDDEDN